MECAENLAAFEKRYQIAWLVWKEHRCLISFFLPSVLEVLLFFFSPQATPFCLDKPRARQRRWDLYSEWDEHVAHPLAKQAGGAVRVLLLVLVSQLVHLTSPLLRPSTL